MRRLLFNLHRQRKPLARALERTAAWLTESAETAQQDPAASAEEGEERARVAAGIAELPPPQRELLMLRPFEGLKYREISELLAIPMGTVMSRLYAARKRLATVLAEAETV